MLPLALMKLALRDLLDARRADLLLSLAGRYYEGMLEEHLEALEALPLVLTSSGPFTALLDTLDSLHTSYGTAIYLVTEIYLRTAQVDVETAAAAQRIRAAFTPALEELAVARAGEARPAPGQKPLMRPMKADLTRFPLADGRTLLDTATAFLDAGTRLHQIFSECADLPRSARTEAARIRAATARTLERLRGDVVRELEKDPGLPRDLEERLFGYLDTLEEARATGQGAPIREGKPVTHDTIRVEGSLGIP